MTMLRNIPLMWLIIGMNSKKVSQNRWSGHHNVQITILFSICGASWMKSGCCIIPFLNELELYRRLQEDQLYIKLTLFEFNNCSNYHSLSHTCKKYAVKNIFTAPQFSHNQVNEYNRRTHISIIFGISSYYYKTIESYCIYCSFLNNSKNNPSSANGRIPLIRMSKQRSEAIAYICHT